MYRLALCTILGIFGPVLLTRAALTAPVSHEDPHAYCARVATDDTLRAPPPSLAPAIRRLFDIADGNVLNAFYYRCARGRVKVCAVGANLPCGKANISKNLPAAARWCHTHINSEFIPAYVTGHDSLYSWRCSGGRPEAGARVGTLDARGFFDEYWKTVK
jgi:hypothetical protein